MQDRTQLSDTWLKASVLGSTWAASEILLGSFLHNLRIPLNGNILTAIGLVLMISAAYKWSDKGLFWRSGLICALMKTMSPSAVIFGPMIAIFMESLLFEISVRIIGRNIAGFLLGSALAMSWILAQKIINFIIFYGFNIVEIYTQLMQFAKKQLNFNYDLVWMPILFLLIIYISFGLFAAFIGIRIGKKLISKDDYIMNETQSKPFDIPLGKNSSFKYSIYWLITNFIMLSGMLLLINISEIFLWVPSTLAVIAIWSYRYKRGLKQLARIKFWIFFIIVTMLAAFTITFIQGENSNWLNGLLIGLKMNFRAAVVIVGFSVIGTELYNPAIRSFFSRTSFRQLPFALELAFESLPFIIGNLPDLKSIFRKPVLVIHSMLYEAEKRFQFLKKRLYRNVFILTGSIDSGKTTFVKELLLYLDSENILTGGVYAEKFYNNGSIAGYNLVNISTGEKAVFLMTGSKVCNSHSDTGADETVEKCNTTSISKYEIVTETLEKGKLWLQQVRNSDIDLIIIDEIGKWELEDHVWSQTLSDLTENSGQNLLIVVRDNIVDKVEKKWKITNPAIFHIEKISPADCGKKIAGIIKNKQE